MLVNVVCVRCRVNCVGECGVCDEGVGCVGECDVCEGVE